MSVMPSTSPTSETDDQVSAYVEYLWVLACYGPASGDDRSEDACYAARICPNPDELLYRLWGRPRDTDTWVPLGSRCSGDTPSATAPPRLRITPALVLNEIRRIGLPVLRARTQPEDKTLVNFDTIFYTEATPFTATVRLLGRQVDIEAEPIRYTWHHGDGTTTTTTSPGAPYPSKEITYRYADAHTTVTHRVDVTYSARFRVDGGTWQGIDETVDVSGTEGMLRVTEAAPVLSGNYE